MKLDNENNTVDDLPLWARQCFNWFGRIPARWWVDETSILFDFWGDGFMDLMYRVGTPWHFDRRTAR
ncbi:hypothetical protein ACFVGM_09130 [Kitasatospora purpeofusca]|uniref:hypothetical protein n=1 Tax=Kitasatospora purpeofusca TaxID=67352 RepID=UPI0036A01E3E